MNNQAEPSRQVFFPNVNFDFDKRTLNGLGMGQAKQVAELLKGSSADMKIVLQGHTDYKGSDAYNMKLTFGMDEPKL